MLREDARSVTLVQFPLRISHGCDIGTVSSFLRTVSAVDHLEVWFKILVMRLVRNTM